MSRLIRINIYFQEQSDFNFLTVPVRDRTVKKEMQNNFRFDGQRFFIETAECTFRLCQTCALLILSMLFQNFVPERPFMHLTVCCWLLISSGWEGGGKVGSRRGGGEAMAFTRLSMPFHNTQKTLHFQGPTPSHLPTYCICSNQNITHGAV